MYSFPSFSQVSNRSHLNFTAAFHHAPFLASIFRQDLFENPPKSWKSPGLRIAKGQKKKAWLVVELSSGDSKT